MDVRSRLKIIVILMSISNLLTFAFLNYNQPLVSQLVIYVPIVLFVFFVLYHLMQGRSWARMLVLIGAVLGLLNFFLLGVWESAVLKAILVLDGVFSLYVLVALNKRDVKEYFKSQNAGRKPVSRKLIWGIVLTVIVVLAVALIFGIRKFGKTIDRAIENSNIQLKSVESGKVEPLTTSGRA
jgi:hypothetical protein